MTDSTRRRNATARSIDVPDVERVERDGRTYLTFPMIPLREGVLDYPELGVSELLSGQAIRDSAERWRDVPLAPQHPEGRQTTASPVSPGDVPEGATFGHVTEPTVLDDPSEPTRLRVHAFLDVSTAKRMGGQASAIADRLAAGEEMAVSAGYGVLSLTDRPGRRNGQAFDRRQERIDPDHIALFPPGAANARCSPEDGCAAPRANANSRPTESDSDMTDTDDAAIARNIERLAAGPPSINRQDAEIIGEREPETLAALADRYGTDPERENARNGPNMAAVPGRVSRATYDGRPDVDVSGYPAAGRSAWERSRANADRENADTEGDEWPAAGTRDGYESRDRTPEYPETARRIAKEREEQERTREQRLQAALKARKREAQRE